MVILVVPRMLKPSFLDLYTKQVCDKLLIQTQVTSYAEIKFYRVYSELLGRIKDCKPDCNPLRICPKYPMFDMRWNVNVIASG